MVRKLRDMISRKIIFVIAIVCFFLYFIIETKKSLIVENKDNFIENQQKLVMENNLIDGVKENGCSTTSNTKFILLWKPKYLAPFEAMEKGNTAFIKKKCKYKNCFVTDDVNVFSDVSEFDAIIFDVLNFQKLSPLPRNRSPKQKYIFGAMESPSNNPVCTNRFNSFFNWTWTYKLNSDFRFGYFTVYDLDGNKIGPKANMTWPEEYKPTTEEVKNKLKNKSKPAAWLVSNCVAKNGREKFVAKVQKELEKFGMGIDIYGKCGPLKCPKTNKNKCFELIKQKYYFYFSLENSFDEDYVTEKVMTALDNYAVPVVFGGANYSRFLPPGSYLDGKQLGPEALAEQMHMIISNKTMYYDFFRWRNHFVYKETAYREDVCTLCTMMNDEQKLAEYTTWVDFKSWWNGRKHEEICA